MPDPFDPDSLIQLLNSLQSAIPEQPDAAALGRSRLKRLLGLIASTQESLTELYHQLSGIRVPIAIEPWLITRASSAATA
jgi:hypothetical protein